MYESVLKQLRGAGLIVDSFKADTNSIERCKVEGDTGKKRSGWYRIFSVLSRSGNTYYVGRYGNWKNGTTPENGFVIEYDSEGLSPDDIAAIKSKQAEAQAIADKERELKRQESAKRATSLWQSSSEQGSSPYLERKQVQGLGIRYSKGSIVIPVCNISGELVGLQFINANGEKNFLRGTPKSGAFHLIGNPSDTSTIIIAEGYATAASIYMATGFAVTVAFDAGNVVRVSSALKNAYPSHTFIIAADNDETGLKYARQAAAQLDAKLAIPTFEKANASNKLTDFNDLHVSNGLDAVRAAIHASTEISTVQEQNKKPASSAFNAPASQEPHNGYYVNNKGLYYLDPNGEGGGKPWRIGGPIKVVAYARTEDGKNYGLMIEFINVDKKHCQWFVPMRLFAAERGSRVVEGLLDQGLEIDPHRNSKVRLMDYLQREKPDTRIKLVGKMGWHGSAYVTPVDVIGSSSEPLHYYSDKKALNRAAQKGSLEAWKDDIARFCVGNPLLMFAVSIPFAGPLLEWLGMDTKGFHMMGPSSLGKSSITTVAGSVCGGVDYYRTWNTTAAALEPTASEHSDSVLILDEINQCDPHTVGKTVYQLGNGEGKTRATDTGAGTRIQHTWRLVWLSNGERSLKEIQERAGVKTEAGQEMRLLHIRADLHASERDRSTKGIYQELHGFAHGAALSEYLKAQVALNHGHAFPAFIEYLCSAQQEDKARLIAYLHRSIETFQDNMLTNDASGQARRAAMAFALVGLSGELATKQGITGWPKGAAIGTAKLLFKNFIKDRGGEGNAEDRAILEQISLILKTKGESNFTRWDKVDEKRVDTHQPRSMERWGFRQVNDFDHYSEETFYIFKEAFRNYVCKGFSYRRACELLKEKGALKTHEGRGYMYQAYLPASGKTKQDVYLIHMSALTDLIPETASNDDTNAPSTAIA